ncbi:hypothetical protein DFH08DRAFT_820275 [Mycena albidolilacea]|uniref:Uncharacterized protein n=1 Tax=Mycena albidolilacea TaxID=1033008 RepID=A0AAD6ZC92_9AGAR|nr:hypothetical protein DFH08DRAFT_820275 [Mycena albidolilacea]
MSDSPQSAEYNMIYGGHMLQLTLPRHFGASFGEFEFDWLKLYGPAYWIKACFGVSWLHRRPLPYLVASQQDRLIIADPVALQYIFNISNFEKGSTRNMILHLMNGNFSLRCVKGKIIPTNNTWQNVLNHLYNMGDTHKRFCAAMNNKFNAPIVRRYQSVFERLAHEANLFTTSK